MKVFVTAIAILTITFVAVVINSIFVGNTMAETEKMLYKLPFLLPLYIKKASRLFRESGCVFVQAHPFRQLIRRANPKYLDGVEKE